MPKLGKPGPELEELVINPVVVAVFTDTVIIITQEGKVIQHERPVDDYDDMPPGM